MKRIALVTGASSGIGRETAILLAKNNYTVYAAARRLERMEDLIPLGISIIELDVTQDKSITSVVAEILNKEGRIDILINNAGFGLYGALEEINMEDARYQLEVNVIGLSRMTQLILPSMRKQKFGKIVNISSIAGKAATPIGSWYHASKFAVEGLSDSLRNEVKQFGIDVIIIEPGGIQSEWAEIAFNEVTEKSKGSPYEELTSKTATQLAKAFTKNSPPSVISNLILKAITSKHPKARYSGGNMAKLVLISKWLLPDRVYDWIIRQQLK